MAVPSDSCSSKLNYFFLATKQTGNFKVPQCDIILQIFILVWLQGKVGAKNVGFRFPPSIWKWKDMILTDIYNMRLAPTFYNLFMFTSVR